MAVQKCSQALAAVALLAASFFPVAAWSATITYSATNISGNTWRYDYALTNDTLGYELFEFTVFFDYSLYENLAVDASPVDWDSLVVEPDTNIPDDGFFDSLNTALGLAQAGSQSGFSVLFDYLGEGAPGAQPFDIVDPDTFDILESGTTTTLVAVPLPAAFWLFSGAIGALLSLRRTNSHATAR